MKKIIAGVLSVTLVFGSFALPAAESGITPFDAAITADAEVYEDFEYAILDDGTVEITGYNGLGGDITIPGTINGKKVTTIAKEAFYFCSDLTSVTISDGVTTIEKGAFSFCSNLTDITIPKSVSNIATGAIHDCKGIKNISVDENNGTYSSVEGVLFSKDKKTLIQYPAAKTDSSYSIPNGTKIISQNSFHSSNNLTSVTIPNSVTSIGISAFSSCLSLKKLVISDGVETIEPFAFDCCINLKEVTIPKSVTSIGVRAFGYYLETSLRKVADFKIKCCYNSAAEKYAKENLFDYEYIDSDIPTVSAVSVTGFSCTTTAVRINWNKVKNASGYRVYRQNPTTKKWEKVATLSGGDTLTYRQSGLKSGTEYIYKVKAYQKSGGKTYWGVASEAFHTVTKPSAVKITKISKSSTAVRFYWKEIKCEAYEIEMYNTATKMWENVGVVHSGQSNNCRISGLKKNKSYKFRLRAISQTYEAMPWERFGAWTEATVRTKK